MSHLASHRSHPNHLNPPPSYPPPPIAYTHYKEAAYEFAVKHMGPDLQTFSIWQRYIDFLKTEQTSGVYEEGQKTTKIRNAYQVGPDAAARREGPSRQPTLFSNDR